MSFFVQKTPADNNPYSIDWTQWLAGLDTILSSTWSVNGLVLTSPSFTAQVAKIWIGGGLVSSSPYVVTNTIVTAGGKTQQDFIFVLVINTPPPVSSIDLTDIATVKAYLPNAIDDTIVQGCITGASQYWLWRTSLASLNSIGIYDEWYDGCGNDRMFLKQTPIVSVMAVIVNGVNIPVSTAFNIPGFVVDGSKKSIAIRNALPSSSPYRALYRRAVGAVYNFIEGTQNVEVQYAAGYDGVPADVKDKVSQMVAVNLQRRGWYDLASKMLSEGGTVSYRAWNIPPEVEACIRNYIPRAIA